MRPMHNQSSNGLGGRHLRLGEILIRASLISDACLEEALTSAEEQQRPLGEVLVKSGIISAHDLSERLQEQSWRDRGFWVIS